MGKAMKAPMKTMKAAMKAMKKVSKNGRKWQVFKGTRVKTNSGLQKKDLVKSRSGKIVSKKMSLNGKKHPWMVAVGKARKALRLSGFQPCGGSTKEGKAFLAKAR